MKYLFEVTHRSDSRRLWSPDSNVSERSTAAARRRVWKDWRELDHVFADWAKRKGLQVGVPPLAGRGPTSTASCTSASTSPSEGAKWLLASIDHSIKWNRLKAKHQRSLSSRSGTG